MLNIFRLLTSRPDVKDKYFPHWSMDDEDKFTHHGRKFMEQVGDLVKCSGDEKRQGDLIEKIHTITRMHATKDIRTGAYNVAIEVLLNFLADALGDSLTADAAAAYKKLLDTMVTVIDKELEVIDNE